MNDIAIRVENLGKQYRQAPEVRVLANQIDGALESRTACV